MGMGVIAAFNTTGCGVKREGVFKSIHLSDPARILVSGADLAAVIWEVFVVVKTAAAVERGALAEWPWPPRRGAGAPGRNAEIS